ncbi:glycosyltransferase family 39 protein [Candidatus Saccharibacteria bacterium]|nr:glycosyltransferase family 39 protein [Candidatus Saccharibacteria bacterium]
MKILKTRFTGTITYQLRYVWLYIVIGALLLGSIIAMPSLTGMRLSEAERASALISVDAELSLANFPYHLLQDLSIRLLGMTPLAIKLPSIVLGVITAILLTLLLNRWYRNLTAFTTATLIVSSVAFLDLTSQGTPGILYVLFPVLMLWLGSQIIDEKPKAITVAALAATTIIAAFIPYMIYFNIAMFVLVIAHPHLRFALRGVSKRSVGMAAGLAAVLVLPLLFFTGNFDFWSLVGPNLDMMQNATATWRQIAGLGQPLSWFSLPVLLLALIGTYATFLDYHIARNNIAFVLMLLTAAASLFWPPLFTIVILLIAILVGNGVGFLARNWRGIFPHNVYATLIALMPLMAFCLMTAAGSISFFHVAPRTIASVHYGANTDYQILAEHLEEKDVLVIEQGTDFYARAFAGHETYGSWQQDNVNGSRIIADRPLTTNRRLEQVLTNSSATSSARFYIYR